MGLILLGGAAAIATIYLAYVQLSAKSGAQNASGLGAPQTGGLTPGSQPYGTPTSNFYAPSAGIGKVPDNSASIATGVGLGAASSGVSLAQSAEQNGLSATSAIPIAGAVVGVVAGVLGAISAHHNAAVKQEANNLNKAVPFFFQGCQLIMQALVQKQLTPAQAKQQLDAEMTAYYNNVISSLEMNNKEKGISAMRAADVKLVPANQAKLPPQGAYKNTVQLSHCNGPCVVAVVYLEDFCQRCKDACDLFAAGQHGVINSVQIAPHAGFSGYPVVYVQY